ncbi:hypothetical protein L7F22_063142 [Adiantum nelumboides]|nr:hypothetical protein [Adiantum nelumboides]
MALLLFPDQTGGHAAPGSCRTAGSDSTGGTGCHALCSRTQHAVCIQARIIIQSIAKVTNLVRGAAGKALPSPAPRYPPLLRLQSTAIQPEVPGGGQQHTRPTRPAVAYHLFFCAAMVYLIIVVGGLTRLTESGLSITEWNPGFKGMRMPWTDAEWDAEWEKYKRTPEWALLNQHMSVDDFKSIYMWEWSHRIIGRLIGVAFLIPATYFVARGYVAKGGRWKLMTIGAGIGFQGALGWFMVKSGLAAPPSTPPVIAQSHSNSTSRLDPRMDGSVSNTDSPRTSSDWHPPASRTFAWLPIWAPPSLSTLGCSTPAWPSCETTTSGTGPEKAAGWLMSVPGNALKLSTVLANSRVGRFRNVARAMTGLVFVTAMTGALVAGLDAGLVYSEFPFMGEGIAPPREELLDPKYALGSSSSELVLGNVSQNPVTVQFVHRCLAVTTWASVTGLAFYAGRLSSTLRRAAVPLPTMIPRLAILASLTATMQATLGITTLIYLYPLS